MGDNKRQLWIVGAVVACLVVVAASWFGAISPTYAKAAETRAQAVSTQDQNDLLELRLAKLRADFERLPEYRDELAAIRTQIPTDAELATYLRQLDEIAVARTVTLTTITPSPPVVVVPAVAAAPVAPVAPVAEPAEAGAAAGTGATAEAGAGAAAAPAAPVPGAAPEGFVAVPLTFTVVGTYANTTTFLDDAQTGTDRLFLVTNFQVTGLDAAEASGGRPATAVGDVELVVTGFAYVLADPVGTVVEPVEPAQPVEPGATPGQATLPAPVEGKNPLIPSGG